MNSVQKTNNNMIGSCTPGADTPFEKMNLSLPSLTQKLKRRQGQHTIEYAILLILIMAGIIIAGPYVVRSWNANLKGWEDSVEDTLQDPLLEAPPGTIGMETCTPNVWVNQGCGLGHLTPTCLGSLNCTPTEQFGTRSWDPLGCECTPVGDPPISLVLADIARCVVDGCCCTDAVLYAAPGNCGANVTWRIGEPNPANDEPACNLNPNGFDSQKIVGGAQDGTCPDGMVEAWMECGDDVANGIRRYGCVNDPGCIFNCVVPGWAPNAPDYISPYPTGYCLNDDILLPADNVPTVYIDNVASLCTAQKCEYHCATGYFAQGGGTYCDTCTNLGVRTGSCAAGYFDRAGCASPYLNACCYSP